MADETTGGAVEQAASPVEPKPKTERKGARKKTAVDFMGRESAEGRDFLGRTI